ncbi:MAG TPA: iron-containing alcohol dehydrogenase [Sedimentisphaerales bacterium]|nr:iron-containing alcohol dehydrogenase [Sedimentisphaerales bacterium]
MNFEFATAGRIIFGSGAAQQIAPLAAKMGTRALVVTDTRVEGAGAIIEQLNQQGLECLTFEVDCEPTTDLIRSGAEQARRARCNLVIGIGGGSVVDTGKAIAAMLTNKGELEDYLEVVGKGRPLTEPPVPYIAVPTTAGTGAEVTRNAVLAVPEHRVKVSMRSPLMLPRVAVVDPVLTYSMPPAVTASTGLDALTQVMEPYVSNKANPLTDGICREGLTRAARSLRRAYENGGDASAREDMSLASLFGGLALANAGLGAVHGFAGPLGGMIHAPHGVICARLLPHVMETNVLALQARAPDSPALARYDQVAQILTGVATANASDGVAWVQGLCEVLKVPALADFGLKQQDFPAAVAKAQKASSMKGNPIALTADELIEILTKAA